MPSGASNKGPYNEDLVKTIGERQDAIARREGVSPDQVPPDAVTASASGLDPAISVAYADLQAARVARNTGLPLDRVKQLVAANTSGAGIGVPGVDVLQLNLAVRGAAGGAH
jgi:K+-transporting ATPase ATPase C chain